MKTKNISVKGELIDNNTRCSHYHAHLDVIAIKFKCCKEYYACYYCHVALADHAAIVWDQNEFDTHAILCGVCYKELTIHEYKNANNNCPYCKASFNPKCVNHHDFYFESST